MSTDPGSGPTGSTGDQAPRFSVVRGQPSDEEVAALVVVLTAVTTAAAATPDPPAPGSGWSARARGVRTPLAPGPGAWRLSGRA